MRTPALPTQSALSGQSVGGTLRSHRSSRCSLRAENQWELLCAHLSLSQTPVRPLPPQPLQVVVVTVLLTSLRRVWQDNAHDLSILRQEEPILEVALSPSGAQG